VMVYTDHPDPVPGSGEVLVDVAAAGVNFIDIYQRSGLYKMPLPFIAGSEGAGTVSAVGEAVEGLQIGDAVAWASRPGSYAEKVAVPAASLVHVPDGVRTKDAAAAMLQGLTAHYLVTSTYELDSGDKCLIHAGAGGVGALLIQMAKRVGAQVFATVGSAAKAEVARAAGADHVIIYTETDFASAVADIAGPKSLDVVYDGVGQAVFMDSIKLLRRRGTMATFGNASGAVEPVPPLLLSQLGSLFLTRPSLGDYLQSPEELAWRSGELFSWIKSGDVKISIGLELQLSEAPEAHRRLAGRETTGKVLLIP
jgi:NADPH2:quinone reductase